ncbi:MAG: hypothetical protein JO131_09440, partial [Gammaproteobacteria bacterium]|nr:hypothetical protein [Gammaproteobacteria bacterium]
ASISLAMAQQAEFEREKDQKLNSIINILNETSTIYTLLRKNFKSSLCQGKILPLFTLGTIATTAYCWTKYHSYIDSFNQSYNLFTEYFDNGHCGSGTFAVSGCDYFKIYSGYVDETCKQLWNNACSIGTIAHKYLATGITSTIFTAISTSCFTGCFPWPSSLTLEDYLQPNEISFLNEYNLIQYTKIKDAIKIVETIIASRIVKHLLPSSLWEIVEHYLAPLLENQTFDMVAIEKEAKTQSVNISKWGPLEIINNVKMLEQVSDNLEMNLKGFQDIEDSKTQLNLYDNIVNQAREAKVLSTTLNIYSKFTERQVANCITGTPSHLLTNKTLTSALYTHSNLTAEIIHCNKVTKTIQKKLNFFAENTINKVLDSYVDIRKKINHQAEVGKNKEAIKFIGFMKK